MDQQCKIEICLSLISNISVYCGLIDISLKIMTLCTFWFMEISLSCMQIPLLIVDLEICREILTINSLFSLVVMFRIVVDDAIW